MIADGAVPGLVEKADPRTQRVGPWTAVVRPLLRLLLLHHVAADTSCSHGIWIWAAARWPPDRPCLRRGEAVCSRDGLFRTFHGAWGRRRARRILGYVSYAGAAVLLLAFTWVRDPVIAILALSLSSFTAEFSGPISWTAAMDMGSDHVGTVWDS